MIIPNQQLQATFVPPQLGYVPSGVGVSSQVVIGRDTTGKWEAIGGGPQGRPDALQRMVINLSPTTIPATLPGKIVIDVNDIFAIASGNSHAPANYYFKLTEVAVCVDGVEKRMAVLASQTYLPA